MTSMCWSAVVKPPRRVSTERWVAPISSQALTSPIQSSVALEVILSARGLSSTGPTSRSLGVDVDLVEPTESSVAVEQGEVVAETLVSLLLAAQGADWMNISGDITGGGANTLTKVGPDTLLLDMVVKAYTGGTTITRQRRLGGEPP